MRQKVTVLSQPRKIWGITEIFCWKMQEPQLSTTYFLCISLSTIRALEKLNSEYWTHKRIQKLIHCLQIDIFFCSRFLFNFNRIFSTNKSINSWFCEIHSAHELSSIFHLYAVCGGGDDGEVGAKNGVVDLCDVLVYLFTCVIHKIKCVCWNVCLCTSECEN